MKLAINSESLEVLTELAKRLPCALEEIEEQTERLMALYNSLAGSLGPHEREIADMLAAVKQAQLVSGDTLHETACIFDAVAQKMASILEHGPAGTDHAGKREDIRYRYSAAAKARLNSPATSPLAQSLYQAGKGKIRITDYAYKSTPRYNYKSHDIRLDALADLHNPTGNMSTYFHEVGHMLDHLFANGQAWLSSAPEFAAALQNDFESNVKRTMEDNECDRDGAYDIMSEKLSGVWESEVSDISGSLSGCRCQGDWGHSPSYWSRDTSRIEKEAFANMFEASIGDEHKLMSMKSWFPNAYRCFESIIGGALS